MTPRPRSQRGFTLVELLVVIVIVGALSAIVAFAVSSVRGEADSAACQSDEHAVTDAEESHHALTGSYAAEDTLVSDGQLHEASTLHDIELTLDDYTVVPAGNCVPGDEVAIARRASDDAPGLAIGQSDPSQRLSTGTRISSGSRLSTGRRINSADDSLATANLRLSQANAGVDGFDSGWTTTGAAQIGDGSAVLTPAKRGATGGVLFGAALPAEGLHATFSARDGKGGTLAFVTSDPDTGIDAALEVGTATNIPNLDDSWHDVTVEVSGSTVVITVDGTTVAKHATKLTSSVLIGFTGASGDASASPQVTKIQITS